eukprot:TRINITY_DN11132_c0_g1_i11.p1 TRINITY_DN11132_c0_g1~~TRINITY_DN11132_c0_g1_i11.p1  ORF type:complete len:389 (-),score=87.49 TRINITY_DN11132_c0_g1_i11:179-1345(-)
MYSTTESSLVVKLDCEGAVKRTRVVPRTLEALKALITEHFPLLVSKPFRVTYKDAQSDTITVASDQDLHEAYLDLKDSKKSILKFSIETEKPKAGVHTHTENPKDFFADVHYGVQCDGCSICPIRGDRHKCKVCPDYDLCSSCMKKGVHREHELMKVGRCDGFESFKPMIDTFLLLVMEALKKFGSTMPNLGGSLFRDIFSGQSSGGAPWVSLLQSLLRDLGMNVPSAPNEEERKGSGEMGIVVGGEEKRTVKVVSAPNQIFIAEWKLKNISQNPWPAKITAMKVSGSINFSPIESPGGFKPGELIDLSIPVAAPKTPGKHTLQLMIRDERGWNIAGPLSVELIVLNPNYDTEELWWKASEMAEAGHGTIEECYNRLASKEDQGFAKH